MKILLGLLFLSTILFSSCMDEENNLSSIVNEKGAITRSITGEVSPIFNWEDTATISLFGVNGNVVLPWYSGATANIPFFILNDYKAVDGWKMVYNTCTNIDNPEDGKYYLIFYNIFTGKMRTYIYNKNDVTSGDITFWQLTFNNQTTLLNDLGPYTLPGDSLTNIQEMFVSNLTLTPTKSLNRGWNVFEADFMVYDPSVLDKNIAMSISAYDVNRENLEVLGDVDLYSKGTMVTTTNITSASTPKVLNSAVSLLGNKAEEKFKKWFPDKKKDNSPKIAGSLIASSVKGIVSAGGNFLVKKFFGRESTQTIVSNSDIKISTDGIISNKGTITSQQQSNVSPISLLPLPGSKPLISDFLLPSYDKPMGVWYLEDSPIVKVDTRQYIHKVGQVHPLQILGVMMGSQTHELDQNQPNVVINPAILPFLEKYTVSFKLQYTQKDSSGPPPSTVDQTYPSVPLVKGFFPSSVITYSPVGYSREFYSLEDRLLVLFSSNDFFNITFPISNTVRGYSLHHYDLLNGMPFRLWQTQYFKINQLEVKITVTLYPKSPFNTDPIISTRTFRPKIVHNVK